MPIELVKEIVLRPIGAIKPRLTNARVHPTKQISKLIRSIKESGFINPLLVDEDGVIVAGHARWEAARRAGLDMVPVIILRHLSPAEIRRYVIADNRLYDEGSWSKKLLSIELNALAIDYPELDLSLTGFDVGEIELLQSITLGDEEASIDEPALPEVQQQAVSRLGDLWTIGNSRLLNDNSEKPESFDKVLGLDRADLILTDPPYGVRINGHVSGLGKIKHREFVQGGSEMDASEFATFLSRVISQMARVSRSGSLHYIFMDWRSIRLLLDIGDAAYDRLLNVIVWSKSNPGMGSFYRSQHELVALFRNGRRAHTNNIMLSRPVGWIISPDPSGFGTSKRSKIDTRLPSRVSSNAAANPAGPQPAIAMSSAPIRTSSLESIRIQLVRRRQTLQTLKGRFALRHSGPQPGCSMMSGSSKRWRN